MSAIEELRQMLAPLRDSDDDGVRAFQIRRRELGVSEHITAGLIREKVDREATDPVNLVPALLAALGGLGR
jgi:hypothetical protein